MRYWQNYIVKNTNDLYNKYSINRNIFYLHRCVSVCSLSAFCIRFGLALRYNCASNIAFVEVPSFCMSFALSFLIALFVPIILNIYIDICINFLYTIV